MENKGGIEGFYPTEKFSYTIPPRNNVMLENSSGRIIAYTHLQFLQPVEKKEKNMHKNLEIKEGDLVEIQDCSWIRKLEGGKFVKFYEDITKNNSFASYVFKVVKTDFNHDTKEVTWDDKLIVNDILISDVKSKELYSIKSEFLVVQNKEHPFIKEQKQSALKKWNTVIEAKENLRRALASNCGYCKIKIREEGNNKANYVCPLEKSNSCTCVSARIGLTGASSLFTEICKISDDMKQKISMIRDAIKEDIGEDKTSKERI